jgi:hypothetical protein
MRGAGILDPEQIEERLSKYIQKLPLDNTTEL